MVSAPRMKIGVAKEIKQDEYRVALTPAGALGQCSVCVSRRLITGRTYLSTT